MAASGTPWTGAPQPSTPIATSSTSVPRWTARRILRCNGWERWRYVVVSQPARTQASNMPACLPEQSWNCGLRCCARAISCSSSGHAGGVCSAEGPRPARFSSARTAHEWLPGDDHRPLLLDLRAPPATGHGVPPLHRGDARWETDHGLRRWRADALQHVRRLRFADRRWRRRGAVGGIYNIGGGDGRTLNEAIGLIAGHHLGVAPVIEREPARPGDQRHTSADIGCARAAPSDTNHRSSLTRRPRPPGPPARGASSRGGPGSVRPPSP